MLVHEVVEEAARRGSRVIDATAGALRTPLVGVTAGTVDLAVAGDSVLVVVDRDVPSAELLGLMSQVTDGVRVLLLVSCRLSDLPVGRLVDATVRSGLQATAALPVEHRGPMSLIVLERSHSRLPIRGYLSSDEGLALDESGLRRLMAEYVIDGAASRAREVDDEAVTADLTEQLADAQAQLALRSHELETLRRSRTYQVGKAFSDVRKSPLSGSFALPGKLRRAGKAAGEG